MRVLPFLYLALSFFPPALLCYVLWYLANTDMTTRAWVAGASLLYPLGLSLLCTLAGLPLLAYALYRREPIRWIALGVGVSALPLLYFLGRVAAASLG